MGSATSIGVETAKTNTVDVPTRTIQAIDEIAEDAIRNRRGIG